MKRLIYLLKNIKRTIFYTFFKQEINELEEIYHEELNELYNQLQWKG